MHCSRAAMCGRRKFRRAIVLVDDDIRIVGIGSSVSERVSATATALVLLLLLLLRSSLAPTEVCTPPKADSRGGGGGGGGGPACRLTVAAPGRLCGRGCAESSARSAGRNALNQDVARCPC